jgi:hypothetical protein
MLSFVISSDMGHEGFGSTQFVSDAHWAHRTVKCRILTRSSGIDQNNLDERNHQVGLMDRIYTQAARVFSCIHSPTSNYEDLFRKLQGDHSRNYTKDMASGDLNELFSSRYFDRVWVIQEVALARAAYLLVNDDVLPLTAHVIDRMKHIQAGTKMLPSVLRWSLGRKMKLGIIACLHASSSCQATDPRDRVYAVMGLMEAQAKSLVPVNYSFDLHMLYRIAIAAIIITQKNLDVLLFSAVNKTNPGADWRAEPCLSINAFQRYLDSTDESSEPNVHEFEIHKLFVKPNPWCATITVAAVQDFCDFSGHENVSCLVEIPQDAPSGLLPRLRVRAHYIDSVCVVNLGNECADSEVDNSRGSLPSEDIMFFYPSSIFEDIRVTNCFRGDATSADDLMPEAKMVSTYDKSTQLDINSKDLQRFQQIGAELGFHQRMFTSRFSVGFRPFSYPPRVADEIFAIDGTKELFIMRKTADQEYRIISKCYLWAAWELDCWNPGTRKGRWGPSLSRPTVEQTRMIEIY